MGSSCREGQGNSLLRPGRGDVVSLGGAFDGAFGDDDDGGGGGGGGGGGPLRLETVTRELKREASETVDRIGSALTKLGSHPLARKLRQVGGGGGGGGGIASEHAAAGDLRMEAPALMAASSTSQSQSTAVDMPGSGGGGGGGGGATGAAGRPVSDHFDGSA